MTDDRRSKNHAQRAAQRTRQSFSPGSLRWPGSNGDQSERRRAPAEQNRRAAPGQSIGKQRRRPQQDEKKRQPNKRRFPRDQRYDTVRLSIAFGDERNRSVTWRFEPSENGERARALYDEIVRIVMDSHYSPQDDED